MNQLQALVGHCAEIFLNNYIHSTTSTVAFLPGPWVHRNDDKSRSPFYDSVAPNRCAWEPGGREVS